jgi:hypothetical protein
MASDFNAREWLKTDEAKAATAKIEITPEPNRRNRPHPIDDAPPVMGPEDYGIISDKRRPVSPITPPDESPPNRPDHYGVSVFRSEPAPVRPPLRVVTRVPEPQDLPASLLPVPPFDPDLLPENFRPWAEDIGLRMQVPLDYVAIAAMIGAGTLIGRKIVVRPKQKDNWNRSTKPVGHRCWSIRRDEITRDEVGA